MAPPTRSQAAEDMAEAVMKSTTIRAEDHTALPVLIQTSTPARMEGAMEATMIIMRDQETRTPI